MKINGLTDGTKSETKESLRENLDESPEEIGRAMKLSSCSRQTSWKIIFRGTAKVDIFYNSIRSDKNMWQNVKSDLYL